MIENTLNLENLHGHKDNELDIDNAYRALMSAKLTEIAQALPSAVPGFDRAMQIVVEGVRKLTGADSSTIALLDKEHEVSLMQLLLKSSEEIEQATSRLFHLDSILDRVCCKILNSHGFDFATMQLIHPDEHIIETVIGVEFAKEWASRARHYLEEDPNLRDIQADIALACPPRIEIITGWDKRFDHWIYETFNHDQLVRAFVPILLVRDESGKVVDDWFNDCQWKITSEEETFDIEKKNKEGHRTVLQMEGEKREIEIIGTVEVGYQSPEDSERKIKHRQMKDLAKLVVRQVAWQALGIRQALLPYVLETIVKHARQIVQADSATLHLRNHRFTQDEIDWVELFAHRAVDAIRHATVYVQMRDRARQLASLESVAESLVSVSEKSELLRHIAWSTLNVLAADGVTVYVYIDGGSIEPEKRFRTPPGIAGHLKTDQSMATEIEKYDAPVLLVEWLVKRGEKCHYSEQAEKDHIFNNPNRKRLAGKGSPFVVREGIVCSAGILLQVSEETVGVMFINYRRHHLFSEEEKSIIDTLASLAAIAIKNRRSVETLRDKERKEARNEAEAKANQVRAYRHMSYSLVHHEGAYCEMLDRLKVDLIKSKVPNAIRAWIPLIEYTCEDRKQLVDEFQDPPEDRLTGEANPVLMVAPDVIYRKRLARKYPVANRGFSVDEILTSIRVIERIFESSRILTVRAPKFGSRLQHCGLVPALKVQVLRRILSNLLKNSFKWAGMRNLKAELAFLLEVDDSTDPKELIINARDTCGGIDAPGFPFGKISVQAWINYLNDMEKKRGRERRDMHGMGFMTIAKYAEATWGEFDVSNWRDSGGSAGTEISVRLGLDPRGPGETAERTRS